MRIKVPPLHHHRASGRARVSYRGKHYYFGVWGRVETEQAYRRWAAEFVSSGGVELEAVDELPVSALVAHYLNYTRTYYPPTSSMHDIIGRALAPVVNLYGNVPVSEFGPKQLMAVRGVWLYPEHGRALARATVNKYVGVIRRMFAWGAKMEYVDTDTKARVLTVDPLRKGRSVARETQDIEPVSEAHLKAVLELAPGVLHDMINVQLLCGARPGEVCALRRGDIDTTTDVWTARLEHHKGEWRDTGRPRVLAFGPLAQGHLKKYLLRPAEAFIFDPRETLAEIHGKAESHRRPNQKRETPKTERRVNDHYTTGTYRRAIVRLCEKAKIPAWNPNQLRKLAATRAREHFDSLDAAQILLGHSSADTTQVYAKLAEARLIAIAKELG